MMRSMASGSQAVPYLCTIRFRRVPTRAIVDCGRNYGTLDDFYAIVLFG